MKPERLDRFNADATRATTKFNKYRRGGLNLRSHAMVEEEAQKNIRSLMTGVNVPEPSLIELRYAIRYLRLEVDELEETVDMMDVGVEDEAKRAEAQQNPESAEQYVNQAVPGIIAEHTLEETQEAARAHCKGEDRADENHEKSGSSSN